MGHEQDIRAWLSFADMDYDAANILHAHHPRPCEIICYHCQQAAEKAIKAVYIYLEMPGGIPRKHDLSFLLNQIQNKIDISKELRQYADVLNVYGIVSRYPNEIHVDDERTKVALDYADYILEWAKRICME